MDDTLLSKYAKFKHLERHGKGMVWVTFVTDTVSQHEIVLKLKNDQLNELCEKYETLRKKEKQEREDYLEKYPPPKIADEWDGGQYFDNFVDGRGF